MDQAGKRVMAPTRTNLVLQFSVNINTCVVLVVVVVVDAFMDDNGKGEDSGSVVTYELE